jgi:hypothetical protein
MIYTYSFITLLIIYICKIISNKFKKISDDLDNIKKEFYFVDSQLNHLNDKNNYIQNTLVEIEQDGIQNYKHIDEKFSVYNKYILKELKIIKDKDNMRTIKLDING